MYDAIILQSDPFPNKSLLLRYLVKGVGGGGKGGNERIVGLRLLNRQVTISSYRRTMMAVIRMNTAIEDTLPFIFFLGSKKRNRWMHQY